jgi:hypothetical protein
MNRGPNMMHDSGSQAARPSRAPASRRPRWLLATDLDGIFLAGATIVDGRDLQALYVIQPAECGEEIDERRLEAEPTAVLCIRCAAAREGGA